MAIQTRNGDYPDFDPTKLLPGEWACVRNGDPKAEDGRAVYMAFEPGVVKRMATYDDMVEQVEEAFGDAAEELAKEFTAELDAATETANQNAESLSQLEEIVSSNEAARQEQSEVATTNASNAADRANQAAGRAESLIGDFSNTTLTYEEKTEYVEPASGLTLKEWASRVHLGIKNALSNIGTLTSLLTADKSNLVAAINELYNGYSSLNSNMIKVASYTDLYDFRTTERDITLPKSYFPNISSESSIVLSYAACQNHLSAKCCWTADGVSLKLGAVASATSSYVTVVVLYI